MKWEELRQQVLSRDNYECQSCFQPAKDVHHIIPRRKHGLHILENLISVCGKCHRLIELTTVAALRITTIQLEEETRDRLKGFGKKGESYDDIVIKLMDIAEGKSKK